MHTTKKWKKRICKVMMLLVFIMSFLPYIPKTINLYATEHGIEYNPNPNYHYDGTLWEPGQWYGYYTVGGYMFSEQAGTVVEEWKDAHIPAGLPAALTNFILPDIGVRLDTVAFCLKPIASNWPATIRAFEMTPELCNEFNDVSEREITERDIDALYIATKTLGLTQDAVNVSNEVYTTMRFVCWYIGKCGWQSKNQFMSGIHKVKELLDNTQVNRAKFVSLCDQAATQIESNIGDFETGQTAYMPEFAGRYSSQAPVIDFVDAGNGTYTFTYNFERDTDRYWEYKCPAGVTVEYTYNSVTFVSTVVEPTGMFEGSLKSGNTIPGVLATSGILICKSDDDEVQDMLIPYSGPAKDMTCYFTAQPGSSSGNPTGVEFPTLPDVDFYRYDEIFESHYNIKGEKYDAETNQKLANTEFEILEQSPSVQPSILHNYWGSRVDTWSGWKRCKRVETNIYGQFAHIDINNYDYSGTYCGGHDAQKQTIEDYEAFIEQCEAENEEAEQEDKGSEGGGEGGSGEEADKEPLWDTDTMRDHLAKLEEGYQQQIHACEEFAGDPKNHFFHEVSGSDGQKTAMSEDKQEAYETFINLEYTYTVREIRSHSGYLLHGKHKDDNSISIIRTPSSESGRTGTVILEDHQKGGLPAVYEHAATGTMQSLIPEPGSLLMAEDSKKNMDEKRETGPAKDAEAETQYYVMNCSDIEDFQELNATPTDATPSDATPPNADAEKPLLFSFYNGINESILRTAKSVSVGPYTAVSWEPKWRRGSADSTVTGPDGRALFTWHIWDHRMEGEVHINKRDLDLSAGEHPDKPYDSYGDSQGDATLEGAVYGLYAAQDIIHPDGKSGKIFSANELVALTTTDKNGDASFLVITEGSPTSSVVHNNYDGTYTNTYNPTTYPNHLAQNGDQWIGRPLLLGRYYIKETSRSEGYELSVVGNKADAETNYNAAGPTTSSHGTANVETILAGGGNTGTNGSIIEIKTKNAVNGIELCLYDYPADTKFGIMRTGTAVKPGQTVSGWEERPVYTTPNGIHVFKNTSGSGHAYYRWNYNHTTGKYERFETDTAAPLYKQYKAGEIKKDSHGNPIKVTDTNGNIQYTTVAESKTLSYREYQLWTPGDVTIPDDISNIRNTANERLKEAGYYTLIPSSTKAPWFTLELTGTKQEQVGQMLTWFKNHPFYNAAHVEQVLDTAGGTTALLRYDYLAAGNAPAVLYGTDLYVKEQIPEGNGLYYYVTYDNTQYTLEENKTAIIQDLRLIPEHITMADVIEEHIKTQYLPEYETYTTDEVILDSHGSPVQLTESVPEISENTSVTSTKTIDYLTDIAEYDPIKKCFKVLVRPERLTDEEKNGVLKIETIHPGMTGAKVNGQTLQAGEYLKYVLGVSAAAGIPSEDWTGTYIKDVMLAYDGQSANVYEDADTRTTPKTVKERIIQQRIKVIKDIQVNGEENGFYQNNTYSKHEDWFTRTFGGALSVGTIAKKMQNFRFKVYLKSNLERLFRDETGRITWQDRQGKVLPVDGSGTLSTFTNPYPSLVQKIYTQTLHRTTPLYQDSSDAVAANDSLYRYSNGLIQEHQNPGYTFVLEKTDYLVEDGTGTRTVREYNYDKFFDALVAANHDKWDDAAPAYTSWQPIGNEADRTSSSIENARASDMVRQFAIDWYLKDETEKLLRSIPENTTDQEQKDGQTAYPDKFYDIALEQAIIKSENYLKPFFLYDLDEIYSIEWDSAANGGTDADKTTLSANYLHGGIGADSDGYYYGVSEYLPYGTYVVVEQQPQYADLEDLKNRHYQTDRPKEVTLPSVYESSAGSLSSPEMQNIYYNYSAAGTPEQLQQKYHIRFNEENHIIQAHNKDGDFEVYKYGLDIGKIKNGTASAAAGDYFALTQDKFKPYKNYYNPQDNRTTGDVPYYLSEGQPGRTAVSKYYRYSSVSENKELAGNVPYPGGQVTEGNVSGIQYRDHVAALHGVQTAYDGRYAPMLVPWSVTASAAAPLTSDTEVTDSEKNPSGESSYQGFACIKYRNRFYTSKLRIEKLDSETYENILHDNAIFNIYAAERDAGPTGTGEVKFYEEDTTITGSREFLTAMCASNIQPLMRGGKTSGPGTLFSGIISAGTPICKEAEQIILRDFHGNKTGDFKSFQTTYDGPNLINAGQTTGYLETPQPLGAGVYVLCEVKPPSGYIRSKPIAIEIYSDAITYYKEGRTDRRTTAAVYEDPSDNPWPNGNKPQDIIPAARINVENNPIKLTVEKVKEATADKTVTYKVTGRIDGSLTQIGNHPDYEYACENGVYLGYAWRKGTLEYLKARKDAGEDVEIVYNGRKFAGYGYVTKKLETADDDNQYAAGATLTLFEAIELKPSGGSEDHAYEGLVIERSATGNITRMYMKQGCAGTRIEYVQEDTGDGTCWTAKTVQRNDTDILYYDLDSLSMFTEDVVDGRKVTYGYDKNHRKCNISQLESDKAKYEKTDTEYSIFAFKGGTPYLEFTGGDFTKIQYSAGDKSLAVGDGTVIYHIDRDGSRDAMVDPHTGMAYVCEPTVQDHGSESFKTLVWPINISRDEYGNIIARDKITTSRIAAVGENQDDYEDHAIISPTNNSGKDIPKEDWPSYSHTESGYISGTWESEHEEESHRESTVIQNRSGQNRNNEVLTDDNNGIFKKNLKPVYNEYGLPEYYQRSEESYDKGTDLLDRNNDQVRYQSSDNLEHYNQAAYTIEQADSLYDPGRKLYHRFGESYILENTWVTSEQSPNDPFHNRMTDGQPDLLKRIPAGTYIMEELQSPAGYLKAMPTGITVKETTDLQSAKMTDKTTKTEWSKTDSPETYQCQILDMLHPDLYGTPTVIGSVREGKHHYTHQLLPNAVLALYEAEKVYTSDITNHPDSWYLKKRSPDEEPLSYLSTNSTASTPEFLTARWTTGVAPIYLEAVPPGYYLLEELAPPPGCIKSSPLEIHIDNISEVQIFAIPNDHTKLEIEKYRIENKKKIRQNGAEFTLYVAKTDENGRPVYEDGQPQYHTEHVIGSWLSDDAADYTETVDIQEHASPGQPSGITGFMSEFEHMYRQSGTTPGTSIRWSVKRRAVKNHASEGIWRMEDGRRIIEEDGELLFPDGVEIREKESIKQAWKHADGQSFSWLKERSASYVTHSQIDMTVADLNHPSTRFPTTAIMTYRTEDGKDIRIAVYQEKTNRQGRDFVFEYQFDYSRLPHVNDRACTYLTAEGAKRFDYLPVETPYVLVETGVPSGYKRAGDQLIIVNSIRDIQRYSIENRTGELLVSKTWQGSVPDTKEIQNAAMALYRAAEDGSFSDLYIYLEDRWKSGEDGIYEELDAVNGRIPDGYRKGDRKPHAIHGLEDGIYYVTELESPGYYTRIDPIRLEYSGEQSLEKPQIIRAVDIPVTGELEIIKQSDTGLTLSGVSFELKAYREGEREAVWSAAASDKNGIVKLQNLPVGEPDSNGQIIPYTYKVREMIPPEGYAVNTEVFSFQFKPDKGGISYKTGDTAVMSLNITNEKTKLYIQKKDFDILNPGTSQFMDRAFLAIFEVHGRTPEGKWDYDTETDLVEAWWTTKTEECHLVEGLKAGRSYLLKELEAPEGYGITESILFTVSQDGRSIQTITNQSDIIQINHDGSSPKSVTVSGRWVVRTEMSISDHDGQELVRWLADGSGHTLTASDKLKSGPAYLLTEHTIYSDGTDAVTDRTCAAFTSTKWTNAL